MAGSGCTISASMSKLWQQPEMPPIINTTCKGSYLVNPILPVNTQQGGCLRSIAPHPLAKPYVGSAHQARIVGGTAPLPASTNNQGAYSSAGMRIKAQWTGECTCCAWTEAVQLREILEGQQPPNDLAELYLYYRLVGPANFGQGLYVFQPAVELMNNGVCREDLHPDTSATGTSAPSAAAIADAPLHKIIAELLYLPADTLANLKQAIMENLAAGYGVVFGRGNHCMMLMDYTSEGLAVLNSYGPTFGNGGYWWYDWVDTGTHQALDYDFNSGAVSEFMVCTTVSSMSDPIGGIPPPAPPLPGKTVTSFDQTKFAGIVIGSNPTGTLTYSGDANNLPCSQVLGTAPAPAAVVVPPAASVTDASGNVWTLGAAAIGGSQILINGVQAGGTGAGTCISYANGQIKVLALGNWYLWNSTGGNNGTWSVTTP